MQKIKIEGVVVDGAKKGRSMGFPTANIRLGGDHRDVTNGVYLATIVIGDENFKGVANVGIHPTVGDAPEKLLEVHIFDFDRDIYGVEISVTLLDFIRGERKFKNIDDLILQIRQDKNDVKLLFNNLSK